MNEKLIRKKGEGNTDFAPECFASPAEFKECLKFGRRFAMVSAYAEGF